MNAQSPLHVALIMDGNGRWARAQGRPRTDGHRAGVEAVRRVVEAAPGLGVGTLSLYAFSSDNWKRPAAEVATLMGLFRRLLRDELARLKRNGVRLTVIGRRDRLPEGVRAAITRAEWETRRGERLHLRLAIDYSARDALCRAAARACAEGGAPTRAGFADALARAMHSPSAPDVDLLVRTGGEQRLSDFLLWECAYAELLFTDTPWPAFTADDLAAAVADFGRRSRRFGGLDGGLDGGPVPARPAAPAVSEAAA
ncbi:MAG: di-trans,poly-cis-decaprenylcistransferase [Rhodothermales bacterium]|nr:di-trans,poly-cis-decaprenylcistransferase [Rhodothermales bacterium]